MPSTYVVPIPGLTITAEKTGYNPYWYMFIDNYTGYRAAYTPPPFVSGNYTFTPAPPPADEAERTVTVAFVPTPEEQVAIEEFREAVEAAYQLAQNLPDSYVLDTILGKVTAAEVKEVWSKVDFKINPAGTVYDNPTKTNGGADWNGGNPEVSININVLLDYLKSPGGAVYLALHETSHLLPVMRQYADGFYAGTNSITPAQDLALEQATNDIALATAKFGNLAILTNPEGGGYSSFEPTWSAPTYTGGGGSGGGYGGGGYGGGGRGGGGGHYQIPPIVIDLDGDGIELLSAAASKFRMDVNGDGVLDSLGSVGADDGLLVIDLNGNGIVDQLPEFAFGVWSEDQKVSDLEALAQYDNDGDGWLTPLDPVFMTFLVWRDADGDGVSVASEMHDLFEFGITALRLDGSRLADLTGKGNEIYATSEFVGVNGVTGLVGDVLLEVELALEVHEQPHEIVHQDAAFMLQLRVPEADWPVL